MPAPVGVKVDGLVATKRAFTAAIRASKPKSRAKNFRTIMQYVTDEVRRATPGSGNLKAGWDYTGKYRRTADGWSFNAQVFNRKANTKLWYRSAFSGKRRPKLNANNKQQTYADIIPILDRGSRPHRILPRRYSKLVFRVGRLRSRIVVTDGVSHPGTKAYGMLTETARKLRRVALAATISQGTQVIRAWESQ